MSTSYINEPTTSGKVIMVTTAGEIEIELWSKECPLACRNFVQLCMEGYYNKTIFHRLVKGFIIQGGDPTGTGRGGESIYGKPFKDEIHQRLRFTRRGLLAMANAGRDDNGSQFFFTLDKTPELDKKHTLFGKIVGNTVFNMLKMAEVDVDESERPVTEHRVLSTNVLQNPFPDIVPREPEKKKAKKTEKKVVETKKLQLLSFGDEAEEDEEELVTLNKKLSKGKGKSAHDLVGEAVGLSAQVAVTADELGGHRDDDDEEERDTATVSSVRERLAKQLSKKSVTINDNVDPDLEEMIDEDRKEREKKKLEEMSNELLSMQKEYIKALKKPKEKAPQQEAEQSEAMKMYSSLKMKFKDKSKNIVKQRDPTREDQTMKVFERFSKRLHASNQSAILFDKKIEIEEEKSEEQTEGEPEEKKFGVDLDAEDVEGTDWMSHRFVAEDFDPKVTRAKDANMRDVAEDWYDISDPRNKMNKRRRGEE